MTPHNSRLVKVCLFSYIYVAVPIAKDHLVLQTSMRKMDIHTVKAVTSNSSVLAALTVINLFETDVLLL